MVLKLHKLTFTLETSKEQPADVNLWNPKDLFSKTFQYWKEKSNDLKNQRLLALRLSNTQDIENNAELFNNNIFASQQ